MGGAIFHALAALSLLVFLAGVAGRVRFWLGGSPGPTDHRNRRSKALALSRRGLSILRPQTLRVVLWDGFLLRRLWRASRLRWSIHFSIAWSFAGLFAIGSLGDMASGLGVPLEKDDAWFAALNDGFGLALLAGVTLALVRRYALPQPHTRSLFDDAVVLALLALLAGGGFLVEAGRYLKEGAAAPAGHYAFLGYALSRAAKPLGWDWAAAYDWLWWSHSLLALGFVAYLPYSRLLHMFASPAAIAVEAGAETAAPAAALGAGGAVPMRFLPENGGRLPFSARQLLEMDACTRCGECLRACSSFAVKGEEGAALMGMIRTRRRLFEQDAPSPAKLLRRDGSSADEWARLQEGVFACTLCGRCEEFCPVGIRTRDLALTMRQELATFRCMMPANLELARQAVAEERNVFRFPNEDRAMWTEFLDDLPADLLSKERAEVLYFVGCVSSFSPAVQEIPQAFLKVLLKAGVDVALLAGEEWCCGFPLIVGGRAADARNLIEHNVEQVRRLGARTVVFNCPSCLYAWRKWYPLEGVQLVHSTEFIRDLVRSGRLKFERSDLTVTYHDPCDLGRGLGEYDAPREVLRSFADGGFVELAESRERALCCGGGGDVEMWDPELVGEVNSILTGTIEGSGAGLLVQACPQCKRTTQRGLEKAGSGIRTLDIAELALEFGTFADERASSHSRREEVATDGPGERVRPP